MLRHLAEFADVILGFLREMSRAIGRFLRLGHRHFRVIEPTDFRIMT
jgi:hypothetical protein